MSSASNKKFIGFPPGLILDYPIRLPVIKEADGWIAVEKPAGIAMRQHPWNRDKTDMDTALNKQLQAQKPELLQSGATLFGSVYNIEPEVSGVALFAKHKKSMAELRNFAGSDRLRFTFLLVVRSNSSEGFDEKIADAPLLTHNTKPKMIPSTAKGKKAQTHFKRIHESNLGWALWEAETSFPRFHQVRAHASVEGIPILGDSLYSGPDSPLLSEFIAKKRIAKMHQPIFEGIALHLSKVVLPDLDNDAESTQLTATLPKHFNLLLERLKLKRLN